MSILEAPLYGLLIWLYPKVTGPPLLRALLMEAKPWCGQALSGKTIHLLMNIHIQKITVGHHFEIHLHCLTNNRVVTNNNHSSIQGTVLSMWYALVHVNSYENPIKGVLIPALYRKKGRSEMWVASQSWQGEPSGGARPGLRPLTSWLRHLTAALILSKA